MPWQHYGYPALSEWMASANDLFVLRRFSPLQVRCLLYLQHQIAMKEEQLRKLDAMAISQPPGEGNSGYINEDPPALANHPRPRLLQETIPLLQQYSTCVRHKE
jgi:hypothetical protein